MDQAESDPLESLEDDLNSWRNTRFDRLIKRRDKLPALVAAARRDRPEDREPVRLEDVRSLLIRVVAAAEGAQPTDVPARSKGRVSNPAVLREIFGLTARSKNAEVGDRLVAASEAEGLGASPHTIRQDNHQYVERLAAWLRAYLDQHRPAADLAQADGARALVTRDQDLAWLRSTYRELTQHTGGLFQLWGIAGVGKTTLARQFASQVGPDKVIGFVRIGRPGLFEDDVRRVLRLEGHDTTAWTDEHCRTVFRTAARSLRHVRFLILDDVSDPNQVIALIPNDVRVPVLVTGRERLRFPTDMNEAPRKHPAWRVRTFVSEQSTELLHHEVADLDAETARNLALAVGGHPESLAHVGRCLRLDNGWSATDLLENLSRKPRETLIGLTEALGVPSCAVNAIEHLIGKVDRSSLAYTILKCLIWSGDSGQQQRSFLMDLVTTLRSERPSTLAVDMALKQLERLGLLGYTETSVGMSRMTCQVLRDLTIDAYEPILIAYERLISEPPRESDRRDRLGTARLEYHVARPMQPLLAKVMKNENTPPPALFCIDERDWAFCATNNQGKRRAAMYRITPGAIQFLSTYTLMWQTVPEEELDLLVDATAMYYDLAAREYEVRKRARENQANTLESIEKKSDGE